MRTARFSGHLGGRGVCLVAGVSGGVVCPGVSTPGMCVCPGGVYLGRVSAQWVYTPGPRGRHPSAHCMLGYTPPNRMTDRCKNINLPQTSFPGDKYIETK